MNEEATIKLRRRANAYFGSYDFTVFIDRQKQGVIENGKDRLFKITPVSHSIYVKGWLWSRTKNIPLNLSAGKIVNLECGITMRNYYGFFIMIICLAVILTYFHLVNGFTYIIVASLFIIYMTIPGTMAYLQLVEDKEDATVI